MEAVASATVFHFFVPMIAKILGLLSVFSLDEILVLLSVIVVLLLLWKTTMECEELNGIYPFVTVDMNLVDQQS